MRNDYEDVPLENIYAAIELADEHAHKLRCEIRKYGGDPSEVLTPKSEAEPTEPRALAWTLLCRQWQYNNALHRYFILKFKTCCQNSVAMSQKTGSP